MRTLKQARLAAGAALRALVLGTSEGGAGLAAWALGRLHSAFDLPVHAQTTEARAAPAPAHVEGNGLH